MKPLPSLPTAFTVAQAQAAGVSLARLRAADLDRLFWGSRSRVPRADTHLAALIRLCDAYRTVAPSGFRFSHATAAQLLLMPLPTRLQRAEVVHVAVDRGKPVPRGLAVRGHRLLDLGSQQALGFPVVSPERAWLQLAETLALDELIAAGDHLVKREAPQSTIERLVSSVESWHGRGALHARAALVDVRCGTDSPRETWMRLVMVRAGLPEPVIGYRAYDTLGRYLGRPDLAYVECKISIEYEGDGHRSDPKIFQQDIARRERFEDAGWRVIRVTGHDFQHPDAFVARVRRILASRS